MKFRPGDRVKSVQTGCNFNALGVAGFIKRAEPNFHDGINRYVTERDDRHGWPDGGTVGWAVREYEIDFVEGYINPDLPYEVDE